MSSGGGSSSSSSSSSVDDQVKAVMLAAAQSVAKVYCIGAVGWLSTRFPNSHRPFLPYRQVSVVARFSFHVLTLSLIFSTTAQSVNPNSMGDYWFLIVGAFVVLFVSYGTATVLGWILRVRRSRQSDDGDFDALRIASTFPNIVALPILIFPSLCEFQVVQNGYFPSDGEEADESHQTIDVRRKCIADSNTMIFCYFFSWSLCFWTLGYPQLMRAVASRRRQQQQATPSVEEGGNVLETGHDDVKPEEEEANDEESGTVGWVFATIRRKLQNLQSAFWKTMSSPGFLALLAGVVTGCIPPLQRALFEPAGPLRFLGDAIETMGTASSPLSTIVVAASLVPPPPPPLNHHDANGDDSDDDSDDELGETGHGSSCQAESRDGQPDRDTAALNDNGNDNPMMCDPNFGPARQHRQRRGTMRRLRTAVRRNSARLWEKVQEQRHRSQQAGARRLLTWFVLSRLIVAPAIVVASMIGLECGTSLLDGVPGLAKLVVIINACLPGALIVVVLLKSQPESSDTAAAVAKVYLPSYLISIVTIAAWTALGLYMTLPNASGQVGFCKF